MLYHPFVLLFDLYRISHTILEVLDLHPQLLDVGFLLFLVSGVSLHELTDLARGIIQFLPLVIEFGSFRIFLGFKEGISLHFERELLTLQVLPEFQGFLSLLF